MPVTKVRYKGYRGEVIELPKEAALEAAANDPFHPWPYPIMSLLLDPEPRPTEGYSITTLEQQCVRCVVLQAREDYTLDLNRSWKRFRGTLGHSILEQRLPPNTIAEVRFFANMGGELVHGKVDELHFQPEAHTFQITDYKFPQQVPSWDRVWSDHEAQVNGYRWLVNNAVHRAPDIPLPLEDLRNYQATALGVIYISPDGVKPLEARTSERVPTKPGAKNEWKTVKRPAIWDDEEVEAFFVPKIHRLKEAFEQYDSTGTLPDFDGSFDPFKAGGLHSYSDVVDTCLLRWKEGR